MTNTVKKFIFAALVVIMVVSMLPAVSAASSASLRVTDTVLDGETFTFKVTVDDISDPKGVAGFQFNVIYDKNVFEFVSAKQTVPSTWNTGDSNAYEDLSILIEKGNYLCAHTSIAPGKGAKSGELYTEFTFKAKGAADGKTIKLTEISIVSDDLVEIYKGSDISFKAVTTANPDVSNEPSDAPSDDPSSSDESSEPDASTPDDDSNEPSDAPSDAPSNEGESSEPDASAEPDTSAPDESKEPVSGDASSEESSKGEDVKDEGGFPWWIIVVVAVIAFGVAVFFIIKRRK